MASPRAHLFGNTLRDQLYHVGTGTADGNGVAMSDPTTIPDNLHNPNDFTAANLATTFPTSPGRPTPNSAKKRRRMPDLSRPTATPSHGAQMSMIFRDAATSLQGSRSHTYPSSSNIKRSRLPLSQARSIKFGSTCQDDTIVSSGLGRSPKISQYLGESCEPGWASSEVSRHWASGIGPHSPTPIPFTKAGCATPETLTNQCLGEAIDVGGMCLDDALRVSSASLPSQLEEEGKEPISSGFATPIAPTPSFVENPEEVKYPILENWPSLRSSSDACSLGSDRDDLHSTHDVPFILPFPHSDAEETQRCHIDTWLNRIVEATTSGHSRSPKQCCSTEDLLMDDAPFSQSIAPNVSSPKRPRVSVSNLKQDLQSPLGASSNKENISPSKSSSSPTHPPAQHPQALTPSHSRQTHSQATLQHTKALHFAHPSTLQGHLSLPPKRKRARVDGIASSRAETEMSTARRDFTIHEDQLAGALTQLSPDVDRHRRGRGPKRERCMSYWDEDILQPGSQCVPTAVDGETLEKVKQVLGE